ncbi:GDYXXLXY domain-containing protein [Myxococcota bacterium]|nr:GDYXXLXY domain-containing protein [Myxococcota bacterium]MBU1430388.1 GDYXXLXY domain-containing protein [Myxococcota bacterium]MBU1897692.1 GDYXXLXY domain-containing protein [Myxococcota bacterium]
MNRRLIILGLLLILGAVAWRVVERERTRREGRLVLLALAPVDPRSLMQGDYMVLRYAVASAVAPSWPDDGWMLLSLDADGVGRLIGLDEGAPLAPGVLRLRYRRRRDQPRIGAESFFFEEGRGDLYAQARYGGLRVSPSGDAILVDLYDEQRRALGAAVAGDSATQRSSP